MQQRYIQSTASVSGLTLLCRLLGFTRDILLAYFLGATLALDAFLVAFKLPDLARRIYAEGAISQAILPYVEKQDDKKLMGELLGTLGSLFVFISLLVLLVSPWIVAVLAPGFVHQPEKWHLSSQLLRIIAPFLLFIVLTGIYAAFAHARKRFVVPAMLPALLNLMLIMMLLAGHRLNNLVYWLAVTVVAAGLLQTLVSGWNICRQIGWAKPTWAWRRPEVRHMTYGLIPSITAVSTIYLGFFLDTIFASTLATGSISTLYYAERLTILPISFIGSAMATVLMPYVLKEDKENITLETLAAGFILGLPACIGLFILSEPIIVTLFQHGLFNANDAHMTQLCLRAFALGIPSCILTKLIVVQFFINKRQHSAFICALLTLLVNIALNALLIHTWKQPGLALATSIASWANMLFLLVYDWRKLRVMPKVSGHWLMKCLLANILLGVLLYLVKGSSTYWQALANWQRVGHLSLLIAMALVAYWFIVKKLKVA